MKGHNHKMLANGKIATLLFNMSVPAVTAMIVHSLYHIVDTIFIGKGVGTLGIAAVLVVLPFSIVVFAIASMIGVGGGSLISRCLGARNYVKAEKAFGNIITLAFWVGLTGALFGYFFGDIIIPLMGGAGSVFPLASEYIEIVVIGFPFVCLSVATENVVRAEGNAKTAMFGMLLSSIVNICLDAILIFGLKMGMQGAAIATVVAQLFLVLFFMFHFLSGRSCLHVMAKYVSLDRKIVREIISVGSASFARTASRSLVVIIINRTLLCYGGEIAIASYGIISRAVMFSVMPLFGIAQGMQPILGFSYGAGRFDRSREAITLSILWASLFSMAAFFMFLFFPGRIVAIFSNDPFFIRETALSMKIVVSAFFLVGFHIIVSALFQAIGKAIPSLFLTLSRQIFFLIPFLLVLPRFFQLTGVWLSFPLADCLASIVAVFFFVYQMKKMRFDN